MHSIRRWPRPLGRMANFARRFVMNWMTRGVFPAEKSPDLTAVSGSRAATSTTMRGAYLKKRKAHQTALFSIKSFTVTTRPESRLAIPSSMLPENRGRKPGDDFPFLKNSTREAHACHRGAADSLRLLACHSWERALEKSA